MQNSEYIRNSSKYMQKFDVYVQTDLIPELLKNKKHFPKSFIQKSISEANM